jgi:hypothetical protein
MDSRRRITLGRSSVSRIYLFPTVQLRFLLVVQPEKNDYVEITAVGLLRRRISGVEGGAMDTRVSPTVSKSTKGLTIRYPSILLRWVIAIALFDTFTSSNLSGQERTSDPESYKLKIEGQFWYATPIATVAGSGTQVPISFDKVLGFSTYSTFTRWVGLALQT